MLEASNFEKQKLANSIFGGAVYPQAEKLTLKLFEDIVSLDGVGTEITTAGYAPVTFDNDTVTFPSRTDGTSENDITIQTPAFTADSPEILSAGLFDENGNLRYRKVFPSPFQILTSEFYELAPGELTIQIS
jgi:hypothetical protein